MYDLTDINFVKSILSKYGFKFSKALGQNFIIDSEICPQMARLSGIDDNCGVIEIGPGIGVLTKELSLRAKKVVAIELDTHLLPLLSETLKPFDNIKIINADVLKIDLKELIKNEFGDMPVYVCANLPYYITSPVIMKLLEEKSGIKSVTVMVQREAAQRLCASVGSRLSGAITAAVNYYSKPQLLFDVAKECFIPAPKVDSSVIRLDILDKPSVECDNPDLFFKIISAAFSQRRKTALNSISSGTGFSKEEIENALVCCEKKVTDRAEGFSLEDFARISDILGNKNG